MSGLVVSGLWRQIEDLRYELDARCYSILRVRRAFEPLSLRPPRTAPPELAFHQAMTWLYGLYHEAGRITFGFLIEKFAAYGLDEHRVHSIHYDDVRKLRTYLQHNLNLESQHDLVLLRACEHWFKAHCGSTFLRDDGEWLDCLVSVLKDCRAFLETSISCARDIESEAYPDGIVGQWMVSLERYHPPHQFQQVVKIAIHDIGQDWLDAAQITERYYDKWSRDLKVLSEGHDFEGAARKLVEQTILNERDPPLPITGEDVMKAFDIGPGKEVGRLMKLAQRIYYESPSEPEVLLAALRQSEIPDSQGPDHSA